MTRNDLTPTVDDAGERDEAATRFASAIASLTDDEFAEVLRLLITENASHDVRQ
jgi:hypothetical protein